MDPPSLKELAQHQCMRISSAIQDLGDVRYKLVEPVLSRMNSRQLRVIEQQNPRICEMSDGLWKSLISKDFPDSKVPFDQFRAGYLKLQEDKDRHLGAARERLLKNQKQAAKARAHTTISITEPLRPGNTMPWRSTTMQQLAKQSSQVSRGRMAPRSSGSVPLRSPAHSPPAYSPPVSNNYSMPRSSNRDQVYTSHGPNRPKRPAPLPAESDRKRKSGIFIRR